MLSMGFDQTALTMYQKIILPKWQHIQAEEKMYFFFCVALVKQQYNLQNFNFSAMLLLLYWLIWFCGLGGGLFGSFGDCFGLVSNGAALWLWKRLVWVCCTKKCPSALCHAQTQAVKLWSSRLVYFMQIYETAVTFFQLLGISGF